MAANDLSDELREAARHRGLKLVKSRRRKPGTGDFGHFGLTDAAGTKLLGFGEDGLTATADDIAAYLRKGAAATWAESARTTPGRAKKRAATKVAVNEPSLPPRRVAKVRATPETERVEEPQFAEPVLVVRKARAGDVGMIASITDVAPEAVAALLRDATSMLVAERAEVIGCVAWHGIQTLQQGMIGRLTLIFVASGERRRGTGKALVEAARAEVAKQGCSLVEAMSDIEISNAHGFFRALGFRQASYRFTVDGTGAAPSPTDFGR